jgi:hypothetical protein
LAFHRYRQVCEQRSIAVLASSCVPDEPSGVRSCKYRRFRVEYRWISQPELLAKGKEVRNRMCDRWTKEDFVVVSGRDARGRTTVLPPALNERKWQPGQSGNPSGRGGLYRDVRRLCRDASPAAVKRMIQIAEIGAEDLDENGNPKPLSQRADIRAVEYACNWLLERGFGPPKPFDPAEETSPFGEFHPELLTPAQRQFVQRALELIRQASVPD